MKHRKGVDSDGKGNGEEMEGVFAVRIYDVKKNLF